MVCPSHVYTQSKWECLLCDTNSSVLRWTQRNVFAKKIKLSSMLSVLTSYIPAKVMNEKNGSRYEASTAPSRPPALVYYDNFFFSALPELINLDSMEAHTPNERRRDKVYIHCATRVCVWHAYTNGVGEVNEWSKRMPAFSLWLLFVRVAFRKQ